MTMAAGSTSPNRSMSLTAMMFAVSSEVTKIALTMRNYPEYP